MTRKPQTDTKVDVPADDPVGTMDRFADGLKRVLAAPKLALRNRTKVRRKRSKRRMT